MDMPGGAFVCTYVGNLYTAEESNSIGKNFGDEYFAELDLVENVEGHKDGWESDVVEPDEEESDKEEESKVEEEREEVKSSANYVEDEAAEYEITSKKRRSSRLAVVQQQKKQKKLEDSKKGRMVSARKLFGKVLGRDFALLSSNHFDGHSFSAWTSLKRCVGNFCSLFDTFQGRTRRLTSWTLK